MKQQPPVQYAGITLTAFAPGNSPSDRAGVQSVSSHRGAMEAGNKSSPSGLPWKAPDGLQSENRTERLQREQA